MDTASKSESITVGQWFVTIFIGNIPIIGWIMLLVWAFGSGTHPSKAAWAKALLIWLLIGAIVGFALFTLLGSAIFSAIGKH